MAGTGYAMDRWWGLAGGALGAAVLVAAVSLPLVAAAPFAAHFTGRPDDTLASGFEFLVRVALWKCLAFVALATIAVSMVTWGMRRWLDPGGLARQALRWTWRARVGWILVAMAAALTVLVEEHGNLAYIVVFFALLAAPFWFWNASVAERERFRFPLRPRWPGWPALGASVLLLLAYSLLDFVLPLALGLATDAFELAPSTGWLVGEAALWPASFLLWLGEANLFLDRSRNPGPTLASAWHWSKARAALWLVAVLGVGVAVVMGALLCQTVFAIYLAPQIHVTATQGGQTVPWLVDLLARSSSFLGAAALPLLLFEVAALGRLLWLQRSAGAVS